MVNTLWDNIFRRGERENDLVQVLSRNILFESLSTRELVFLKDLVHVRSFHPGETIFRQGEIGIGMYILVSGNVDIFIEDLQQIEGEPTSVLVTSLGPGDFFGELSLVEDKGRRTATAIARDQTKLVGFFKPDLIDISERNPSTGVHILMRLGEVLGRRLKETSEKVTLLRREIKTLREQSEK
ncbi:MAG: cyclic nucleotide-binding domain-containing protein [Bdellovibrionales bacterium]|nr:cyclic nucleotide-binding domain-containing protein [Bdellovibrionales bacterium]